MFVTALLVISPPYPHHVIIVVVCPLKCLVDSHIHELRNRGISAAGLSSEDFNEHHLLKESYAFLFGRPQPFLQNQKWRYLLRNNV